MSYRRGLSFASSEKHLVDYYDNNGKSDFAKEAMKFFIRFKDKVFIGDGSGSGNARESKMVEAEVRSKMSKLIKR